MSLAFLRNIGITETESTLYELLLKLGEVPIQALIKESGLKRPTIYKALYSLEKKGIVKMREIRKKINVRPESPVKLSTMVEKKYEAFQGTKETFAALLPGLASAYNFSTEKPVVRVYEGIEGLKEIYEDLLVAKQPVYALLQAAEVEPALYEWLTTKFVKKRIKEKIHVKAIVASSASSMEYFKKSVEEYRIARIVNSNKFPFQHEIDIYGDKVAIIHYKKDEPLIGIVIHHPQVAKTMKAWFDLAFEGANN